MNVRKTKIGEGEFMLTRLAARFDGGAESLEGGFGCNGVEAKAMDNTS